MRSAQSLAAAHHLPPTPTTSPSPAKVCHGLRLPILADIQTSTFRGDPEKAVADHFGDRYIQHNPDAADGPETFIAYVKWLRSEHPQLRLEIKRVIAEGDEVATHSHLILEPGQPGRALADFFRLENGKVVEHWDVIQEVPETTANPNGMF